MQNSYEHSGKELSPSIARELIMKHFSGKPPIHVRQLRIEVEKLHYDQGGLKSTTESNNPVTYALDQLKKRGDAWNSRRGFWEFGSQARPPEIEKSPETESDENEMSRPRTIGSGDGEVYVFYFPTYQRMAQSEGKSVFECKIGMTEEDSEHRTYNQTGGMPEERKIGLIIKTDNPSDIERRIHGILKAVGRHKENAPETEWFYTNLDEVEGICNFL